MGYFKLNLEITELETDTDDSSVRLHFHCTDTMVPTFSEWQISLPFPVFFPYDNTFFNILFNKFNK